MAYLGNKPVNNFVSFAKQDITGNGGTSYSLDYPVTGANDIDLYINNVRQEPTEAYSCSGSTLTLTEAVSSSDDIYAIFRGRALQTVVHPSDSALEASQATISGSTVINGTIGVNNSSPSYQVDVTRSTGETDIMRVKGNVHNAFIRFQDSDSSSDFTVGSDDNGPTGSGSFVIYDRNAGSYRWRMDSSGRVTKPYQPAFFAHRNGGNYTETTATAKVYIDGTRFNHGGHYDTTNNRFVAPVDGAYQFNASVNCYYIESGKQLRALLYVNGSNYVVGDSFHSANNSHDLVASVSHVIYLSANDYVEVWSFSDDGSRGFSSSTVWNTFSGYLLG